MEIKNVKQTKVFGKEIKTSLKKIHEQVRVLPERIADEMTQKGIQSKDSQVWVYKGADGNPETEFDLLVGFPVGKDQMDTHIQLLDDFKCATAMHKGDWRNFNESYQRIIAEVFQNGYQMTGECREVYHQVDFENVENNITEVQIGIK